MSTHVVEQLSFSLFPSTLTFDFDSILGLFWTFWGPNGLFLGFGKGLNTVLWSTHVVEQLSFSLIFYVFVNFDIWFLLDFGVIFLVSGALTGYFWVWSRVQHWFGVYSCSWTTLIFFVFFSLLTFYFDLILGSFLLFGAVKGYFGVYSCSWTTLIFYVSFNPGIWIWLNFGFIFDFLGP